MCDKRRIHKQISRDAGDTQDIKIFKSSPESPVSTLAFSESGRIFRCLLLILVTSVVMGGCSRMNSPWQHNNESAKVATQADLATFNEAVLLVESQRYEEAAAKFRQVFDRFAASADHRQRAAETLFWIGFCREKQRRLDEAREIYLRLAEEYSGTRAASEANKRRLRIPAPSG